MYDVVCCCGRDLCICLLYPCNIPLLFACLLEMAFFRVFDFRRDDGILAMGFGVCDVDGEVEESVVAEECFLEKVLENLIGLTDGDCLHCGAACSLSPDYLLCAASPDYLDDLRETL